MLKGWKTLTEAAETGALSAAHLRRLCVSGTLRAQKVGKTWLVDEKSLERYLATEHKRGWPTGRRRTEKPSPV